MKKLPQGRRPRIFYDGWRVHIPSGRRVDGQWSNRSMVEAVFVEEEHARVWAEMRRASGVPVKVVAPGGTIHEPGG